MYSITIRATLRNVMSRKLLYFGMASPILAFKTRKALCLLHLLRLEALSEVRLRSTFRLTSRATPCVSIFQKRTLVRSVLHYSSTSKKIEMGIPVLHEHGCNLKATSTVNSSSAPEFIDNYQLTGPKEKFCVAFAALRF